MNYNKLKTPFYRIFVSDPNGESNVELPDFILKLVERIEIQDSMSKDENSVINIKFIEGSREPAKSDFGGNKGLYEIDNEIEGTITNRIGSLADLRFSSFNGITFTTEKEIKTKRVSENRKIKNIFTEGFSEQDKRLLGLFSEKKVKLLFDNNNRIKITWGYLEDIESVRSVVAHIKVVKASFTENEQPSFTITATTFKPIANMQVSTSAIPFRLEGSLQQPVFESNEINSWETLAFSETHITPLTIKEILEVIKKKLGVNIISSESFLNDQFDKQNNRILMAGESLGEFIERLAKETNSYWEWLIDPETGDYTIIFITKKDFESKLVFNDQELLTYKGPNSILKSVEITADFSLATGSDVTGINEDGDTVKSVEPVAPPSTVTTTRTTLFGKEPFNRIVTTNPAQDIELSRKISQLFPSGSDLPLGATIVNGKLLLDIGTMNIHPSTTKNFTDDAGVDAEERNRITTINFTTIGFPKLIPGAYEINGIGARYSGRYSVKIVKHIIDSNGYITQATGDTLFDNSGNGLQIDNSKKAQDSKYSSVSPNTSNKVAPKLSVREQYEKFIKKI